MGNICDKICLQPFIFHIHGKRGIQSFTDSVQQLGCFPLFTKQPVKGDGILYLTSGNMLDSLFYPASSNCLEAQPDKCCRIPGKYNQANPKSHCPSEFNIDKQLCKHKNAEQGYGLKDTVQVLEHQLYKETSAP